MSRVQFQSNRIFALSKLILFAIFSCDRYMMSISVLLAVVFIYSVFLVWRLLMVRLELQVTKIYISFPGNNSESYSAPMEFHNDFDLLPRLSKMEAIDTII